MHTHAHTHTYTHAHTHTHTHVHTCTHTHMNSSLQLLVDIGGNMNHQDLEGQTPLFLALCEGRKECIERLMEANSSLQAVTKVNQLII